MYSGISFIIYADTIPYLAISIVAVAVAKIVIEIIKRYG